MPTSATIRERPVETQPAHSDPNVFVHPKFRMWLRPDGIVQFVWVPRVQINLEDALESTKAMAELSRGRRSPLFVDARDAGQMDRPSRAEFARRGDIVSAVGLTTGTALSRMMANFFIGVSKPIVPTRLFETEQAAVAWLTDFVE
jgi:hypothetical protein